VTGTATVTIRGIGKYTGTITKTFRIVPRPVLSAKATSKKKTQATITWKKVAGAARYLIYFGVCKDGAEFKQIAAVSPGNLNYTVRKLKKNGSYKFRIAAQKKAGGKYVTICQSHIGHFVGGKHSKYTNPKKVKVKKTKMTVKKGKTVRIKGKVIKAIKKKKLIGKDHVLKLRYSTGDASIATVDKKGKIKGLRKGKVTIYVLGANDVWAEIRVTVK
jgi:hypothetical protein